MAKAKTSPKKKTGKATAGKAITEFKGNTFSPEFGTILFVVDVGREIVVARINEFKKKKSLDIRRFYDNGHGEWAPGKGVSVPPDGVEEFLEQIQKYAGYILTALGKL